MSDIPRDPVELLRDPAAFRATLGKLRALQRLEFRFIRGGETLRCPLEIARNATITANLDFLPSPDAALDPETIVWRDGIIAAGGTVSDASIALADAFIVALKATGYGSKVKYVLPLFGQGIIAPLMPLRDSFGVGLAGNTGFVAADFSESAGLQSDGSSKLLLPGVSSTAVFGFGWWERNFSTTGTSSVVIGTPYTNSDHRAFLALFGGATGGGFQYGADANRITEGAAAGNAHYFGIRVSSTLRQLYKNGSLVTQNTTSDTPTLDTGNLRFFGIQQSGVDFFKRSRCGVAYLTDATMTAADAAAFHTLLQNYIITPTGR